MNGSLEVFRDLHLRGPIGQRSDLREALISAACEPWYYDHDRTVAIGHNNLTDGDVMAFRRDESDNLRAAGLTLWEEEDGYFVPNIVPIERGELGVAQYNAILDDFIQRIILPVVSRFDYRIETTEARQNLNDWTSPEAAQRLQSFSRLANKSTGTGHPLDQRRWFDFIIAVHKSRRTVGTDHLIRWLHEVEGWDEESAHELGGKYETALSLLQRYDER